MITAIETVTIQPTKEMPLDVFKVCHHLAYYMELMERLPDGKVLWNDKLESVYSTELAEAEYLAIQSDWLTVTMEIPKAFFDGLGRHSETNSTNG